MGSITRRGHGHLPAPDPVFPLSHKRPVGPTEHVTTLPPEWPFLSELDPRAALANDDHDEIESRLVPRRPPRRAVVARAVGWVALSATLFGCGFVLATPAAGRKALDWVTVGHPQVVLEIAHRVTVAARALTGG